MQKTSWRVDPQKLAVAALVAMSVTFAIVLIFIARFAWVRRDHP